MINLKAHRLILAIAKKTLDENHFKTAQKTMDRQTTRQVGPKMETGIQNFPN